MDNDSGPELFKLNSISSACNGQPDFLKLGSFPGLSETFLRLGSFPGGCPPPDFFRLGSFPASCFTSSFDPAAGTSATAVAPAGNSSAMLESLLNNNAEETPRPAEFAIPPAPQMMQSPQVKPSPTPSDPHPLPVVSLQLAPSAPPPLDAPAHPQRFANHPANARTPDEPLRGAHENSMSASPAGTRKRPLSTENKPTASYSTAAYSQAPSLGAPSHVQYTKTEAKTAEEKTVVKLNAVEEVRRKAEEYRQQYKQQFAQKTQGAKGNKGSMVVGPGNDGSELHDGMDHGELSNSEKHSRRLHLNRQSAAAARARRDVYIKMLEENLSSFEAEKINLSTDCDKLRRENSFLKRQVEELKARLSGEAGSRQVALGESYPSEQDSKRTRTAPAG